MNFCQEVRSFTGLRSIMLQGQSLSEVSGALLFLIGFAALAAFLDAYQKFFISLGIISNMLGTLFMLRCLQHGISTKNRMLKKIMNHDLKTAMEIASVLGAAFLAAVFLSI